MGHAACGSVRPLVDQIVSLMTVPLVQGALRYAYKNSQAGDGMATPKNAAEGATFSAAVLPLVHQAPLALQHGQPQVRPLPRWRQRHR